MVSRGATWPGVRWFVRVAAVLVGLANMVGVILWFVGGLYVLGGEEASSLREALPSVLAAVLASLATSQIVLHAFEVPGRGFWHRYRVVVISVCIGGAIEGELLGLGSPRTGRCSPNRPLDTTQESRSSCSATWRCSCLGPGWWAPRSGSSSDWPEGLVLGLPLAAVLGALRDD